MARPLKNSCDYFPHDADMRNHRKIKALRNKFGIEGYALWCMFLEFLTSNDNNRAVFSDLELELIAGDFNVSKELVSDFIQYCLQIDLLYLRDDFVGSASLSDRLEPVYLKRGKMRELALNKQSSETKETKATKKNKGTTKTENKNDPTLDFTTEINIDFDWFWNEYDKKVGDKAKLKKKWEKLTEEEREAIMEYIPPYKIAEPNKKYRKNPETFLNNKSWNDEIIQKTEKNEKSTINAKFNNANSIIDAMFNGTKGN